MNRIAAFIPLIHSKLDIVLLSALPMNVLKGVVISLVTMLIYKRLSPILKGRNHYARPYRTDFFEEAATVYFDGVPEQEET